LAAEVVPLVPSAEVAVPAVPLVAAVVLLLPEAALLAVQRLLVFRIDCRNCLQRLDCRILHKTSYYNPFHFDINLDVNHNILSSSNSQC